MAPSDTTIRQARTDAAGRPATPRSAVGRPRPITPAPAPALHHRPVDVEGATQAMVDLLDALGVDRTSPGLAGTPRRVAEMYAELLTPEPFHPTTFPHDAGYDELVVVSDIPLTTLCEHHLLPFRGVAHVGYLPGERIVGLSKLARPVEALCRRPQTQERLTSQVADWLHHNLGPRGVAVVVEAEHLCMTVRGARAAGAHTVTSARYGELRDDAATGRSSSPRREALGAHRGGPS